MISSDYITFRACEVHLDTLGLLFCASVEKAELTKRINPSFYLNSQMFDYLGLHVKHGS